MELQANSAYTHIQKECVEISALSKHLAGRKIESAVFNEDRDLVITIEGGIEMTVGPVGMEIDGVEVVVRF